MPIVDAWALPSKAPYTRQQFMTLALLLLFAVWVMDANGWDLLLERAFYVSDGHWFIEKENAPLRWLMYYGPKYAIAAFGVGLLAILAGSVFSVMACDRRALLFVVVCLALVPALAAFLKYLTGIHCPYSLGLFGGQHDFKGIWGFVLPDGIKRGACFPAGHPSGGFALIALAYVMKRKRIALTVALATGSVMSFYQMARGAHFISHCLATLLLSIVVIDCVYRLLRRNKRSAHVNARLEAFDAYTAG